MIGPIIEYTYELKGSYILFIFLKEEIVVSIRGNSTELRKGYYIYTGSAFASGGLASRLHRHLRKNKKIHWHIDQLTSSTKSEILGVICFIEQEVECKIGELFSTIKGVKPIFGFGNSDCKAKCLSHLFWLGE